MPEAQDKTCVDICVATRRRPQGLSRLLESLSELRVAPHVEYRIIVVENDTEELSKAVVDRFRGCRLSIVYDRESEQNISLARNRAVSHADAEWIATIDDDAVASPEWLQNLLDAAKTYEADGVFGAVERTLPPEAPRYLSESRVFQLPNPPTGTTEDLVYNTVNALFKRQLISNRPGPFDPDFGLSGGGDTELFSRLAGRGAHFVWCKEAKVVEFVTSERTSLCWILQRAFREGGTYYRVYKRWNVAPEKPVLVRFLLLGLWATRKSVEIAVDGVRGFYRSESRARALIKLREIARNLGIAAQTLGISHMEYRNR